MGGSPGAGSENDASVKTGTAVGRRLGTLLAAGLTTVGLVVPAAAARTPSLQVQVGEWNVVPSRGAVAPGTLRLTVENLGRLPHELDVIATASFGEKLRMHDGHAVGRKAAPTVVVGPGQTRSLRVTLMPGFYVLVDNGPGRYALGTEVAILVS